MFHKRVDSFINLIKVQARVFFNNMWKFFTFFCVSNSFHNSRFMWRHTSCWNSITFACWLRILLLLLLLHVVVVLVPAAGNSQLCTRISLWSRWLLVAKHRRGMLHKASFSRSVWLLPQPGEHTPSVFLLQSPNPYPTTVGFFFVVSVAFYMIQTSLYAYTHIVVFVVVVFDSIRVWVCWRVHS